MDAMRVLLTGASGFLGQHILRHANHLPEFEFLALVRPSTSLDFFKENNIPFVLVSDNWQMLLLNNKIDVVLHAATAYETGGSLLPIYQTNVMLPLGLLEAARTLGISAFINISSFFAKHHQQYAYQKNYSRTKHLFEKIIEEQDSPLKCINLVLEHLYGPFDKKEKFIGATLQKLYEGKTYLDLTAAQNKRDFIFVEDAVTAIFVVLNSLDKMSSYERFEVGFGKSITIQQAIETMKKVLHSKTELRFGALPNRLGEIPDSCANILPLSKMGWQPQFDFTSGIQKIIQTQYNT